MKTTNKHIENKSSVIDELKSQNGFKTPQGYFDTLPDSIMNRINEKPKARKITLYQVLGYAASVAVLIGLFSVFFFSSNGQPTEDEFENLTVSEYMENFSEIDLELEESLQFDEIAMN